MLTTTIWKSASISLAALVIGGSAMAQNVSFLNMGTVPSASGQFAYFVSLSQAIEVGTDGMVQATVVETGSSVDNLRRMRRNELDFGVATVDIVGQSVRGSGVFADSEAWPDVRTLFVYQVVPIIYAVREDSGIQGVEDLDGKRINPGSPGTATSVQTQDVLNILGVKPDYYTATVGEAAAAIRNGEIHGYAKTASALDVYDSTFQEISTAVPLRALSFSTEHIERVREQFPEYATATVPGNIYSGQDDPFLTYAVAPGLVTTKDLLSDDDAYRIVKATFEQKQIQIEAFPPVSNSDFVELTMSLSAAPLHSGAVRYFREIGANIPEHLIPPEVD